MVTACSISSSLRGPVALATTKRLARSCTRQPQRSPASGWQAAPFFLHERPKFIDLHLVQMQIAGQHLREGRRMGGCSLQPHADRLVFMPGDLFGRPQAPSSHHDQQGVRHFGSRRLQIIHGRALRFPKVRLAGAAEVPLPSAMAPIAHHMRLPTVWIRTRWHAGLLLALLLVHASPPTLLLYHLLIESLPFFRLLCKNRLDQNQTQQFLQSKALFSWKLIYVRVMSKSIKQLVRFF